jgi:acetyl-CoA carboxylase beta subunit
VSDWPKCPECRNPMWRGEIGAPVRVILGCAHCGTKTQVSPVVEEIPLFELEGP